MNWKAFVEHIKSLGYEGGGDDFASVVSWLRINGHDTEFVDGADGEQFGLKDLFDRRPGKPLDVSAAARKAQQDAEVTRRVREVLEEERALRGKDRERTEPGTKRMKHDVKVGEDQLIHDPKGGYKHFGEMCFDVINAGKKEGDAIVAPRLEHWTKASLSTYGNETTGTDGGFAVPPEFREQIMVMVEGEESLLSRTDQIPISSNSLTIPTDETTPWQTSGGILGYWLGEAGTFTQSKPQLVQKDLKLRKVVALVPVTEELMMDASAMSAYVPRKAGEKLDFMVGEAIFRGNGVTQPLGFMNSGSLISVAKETNQVADTITGANILKMWSRMYAPYRRDAVWLAQQDCEPQLNRLSLQGRYDSGGAATGFGGLIYLPGGNVAGSPFGTLMGRPVIFTQHSETVGDKGDIVLVSLGQYLTATRGGIDQQSSIHLWFDQDTTALKFRLRIDGQPWRDTTITSRDSTATNTLSAFVALDERAA